jgi:hypothetical protein
MCNHLNSTKTPNCGFAKPASAKTNNLYRIGTKNNIVSVELPSKKNTFLL